MSKSEQIGKAKETPVATIYSEECDSHTCGACGCDFGNYFLHYYSKHDKAKYCPECGQRFKTNYVAMNEGDEN